MSHDPIRRIVIVGGGTAGWIAAAMIASHLGPKTVEVELVESDAIGTIGVGESTIPPFLELLDRLGIDQVDFIRSVGASFKLGIEFRDWHRTGSRYFHPFGAIGLPIDRSEFYQCWLKAVSTGYAAGLQDFAPASVMAAAGRFMLPGASRNTPVGTAAHALHVDARRVAAYLRTYAEAKGVRRTEGIVDDVALDDRGFVSTLRLRDGRTLAGDFFIDCSGFRALLVEGALGVGFRDWSDQLFCDRAIAVQTENQGPPAPYTLAEAQPAGWRWRIPLQHRTGNGHVYSSADMSDDEATARLIGRIEGPALTDPMVVRFRTGVRTRIWDRNVLALGLSSGFIEPLESTAIHLVYRGMDFLFRYLPDRDCDPALADEYNRRMTADYEEIRDFIVLHYCTTARDDSDFWRRCAATAPPASLAGRLRLFAANGTLREGTDELFRAASWYSVLEGMGVRPRGWHAVVDRIDADWMTTGMERARATLAGFVATLPSHGDFLARHCPAPRP